MGAHEPLPDWPWGLGLAGSAMPELSGLEPPAGLQTPGRLKVSSDVATPAEPLSMREADLSLLCANSRNCQRRCLIIQGGEYLRWWFNVDNL